MTPIEQRRDAKSERGSGWQACRTGERLRQTRTEGLKLAEDAKSDSLFIYSSAQELIQLPGVLLLLRGQKESNPKDHIRDKGHGRTKHTEVLSR